MSEATAQVLSVESEKAFQTFLGRQEELLSSLESSLKRITASGFKIKKPLDKHHFDELARESTDAYYNKRIQHLKKENTIANHIAINNIRLEKLNNEFHMAAGHLETIV